MALLLWRQSQGGVASIGQGQGEESGDQGDTLFVRQTGLCEYGLQFGELGLRIVVTLPVNDPLQMLDHEIQGTLLSILGATKRDLRVALVLRMSPQAFHQARFAKTGLTTDQYDLALTFFALLPTPQEKTDFFVAAY